MSDVADWWTRFFADFFTELQLAGPPAEQTEAEISEMERVLGLTGPACILDVPCGTGRHVLALARRGHDVTGIDFNPRVLEAGRAAAAREALHVTLRELDMRALDDAAAYDDVSCQGGSFGYFDDADNLDFLCRVGRALRPGGRFLLESHIVETLYPKFQDRGWSWWGEGEARVRVLEERRLDLERGRIDSQWTVLRKGEERTATSSMRIYTYRELVSMLRTAGMSVVKATDLQGAPFRVGSGRLRLVAERKG